MTLTSFLPAIPSLSFVFFPDFGGVVLEPTTDDTTDEMGSCGLGLSGDDLIPGCPSPDEMNASYGISFYLYIFAMLLCCCNFFKGCCFGVKVSAQ